MGIAALICGIISVVCSFTGPGAVAGMVLGIIAIVLGIKARKDPAQAGLATGGLILGIIGTALSGILFISCVVCMGALSAAGSEFIKEGEGIKEAVEQAKDIIDSLK